MWRWVSTFFESPPVRQWMTRQIASSAGQYNVSQSNLASLLIPVPPASEMAEILRRVSDAHSAAVDTLAMLDAEAADAERLKQSILKAAFEGRLVPQDPADEPAAARLSRPAAKAPVVRASRGRARKSYA
jgi:type I restriction enzyme S subunit